MKLILALLSCAAVAAAKSLLDEPTEPLNYYHEAVGVVEAERIRQAEAETSLARAAGGRIAGGSVALPGDFPYTGGLVVTLTTGEISVCSSTLLSNTRAVTAAHCWWDGLSQARHFTVVLGSTYLYSGGVRINTNDVQMHPSYNPINLNSDIAVIVIPHVNYSNEIAPVTLPTGTLFTNNFAGWRANASGFGRTNDLAGISSFQYLSYVQLHVITNSVCQQTFAQTINSLMLCTSGTGGLSTCSGDAGGPLVVINDNQHVLIGIASFGSPLGCTRGFPAVFSRITSFTTWINSLM